MKEIPILFSTPMVIANIEDRKTETRRTRGLSKINEDPDRWEFVRYWNGHAKFCEKNNWTNEQYCKCPYGSPGDLLWVRESIRKYHPVDENGYTDFDSLITEYRADNPEPIYLMDAEGRTIYNKDGSEKTVPWKPSIHMPKAAARIWLLNESVTAERVQDITEAGAIAEGVIEFEDGTYKNYFKIKGLRAQDGVECLLAKGSYQSLWHTINGPVSWDANDWVWVVRYKVLSKTGKPETPYSPLTPPAFAVGQAFTTHHMSSIHKAFYHLQMAFDLFEDERRQNPNTVGGAASARYAQRIAWMKKDFASNPNMPRGVMQDFKREMSDDVLFPAAVAEKVMQLPLAVREDFEKVLDMMLAGEKITMQIGEE